jgi:hypothetical protein
MNVRYSEEARQSREGIRLLEQAVPRLEEAIGPSAARVEAEWDRTEDEKGHPLSTLRISDGAGSAARSFEPDELMSPTYLWLGLLRLWGDVLQARNHRQLKRLQEMDGSEN